LDLGSLRGKKLLNDKGIPFALASFLIWGIYFTFIKIPIKNIGWFWPAYISWWGFPLVYLFMKSRDIKLEFPKSKQLVFLSLINALLLTAALFSFNIALDKGLTAIVVPIASSYPALFAILAYYVFKDRLSKQQVLGVITTLIGIVVLSALS
jgi:uncharacterized membrane protein